MSVEFVPFPKIARFSRDVIITEKIDGTNASVFIDEYGNIKAGSRSRWITPSDDNFGFAQWVHNNQKDLRKLGPGHHFGEWWGRGIQRGYGSQERRFSLFNVKRWADSNSRPACCDVVPVLACGLLDEPHFIERVMIMLLENGSFAAPGFMKPEGIVIYHTASKTLFKKMLENDDQPKGLHA